MLWIMGVKEAVNREDRYRQSVDQMSKKGKIMPDQHIQLGCMSTGRLKQMGAGCFLIHALQGIELSWSVFYDSVSDFNALV